MKISKTDIV